MEFDFDEEENPMRFKTEGLPIISTKNKLAEYADENESQIESSVNITD